MINSQEKFGVIVHLIKEDFLSDEVSLIRDPMLAALYITQVLQKHKMCNC